MLSEIALIWTPQKLPNEESPSVQAMACFVRQQAITWSNVDADLWRHIGSLQCVYPYCLSWWRHQMEAFSASLAICAGNSPVTAQRPVTRSFNVFSDLRLNKRLSKQSWGWWFETLSRPLWRHCNVKPEYPWRAMSIPLLFITSFLVSPGHRRSRY